MFAKLIYWLLPLWTDRRDGITRACCSTLELLMWTSCTNGGVFMCLRTETGSTQTAEEQVISGETVNGWIQLVYWQMDWFSILFCFFFLTDWFRGGKSVFLRRCRREDTKKTRGNETVGPHVHTYTNMYEHVAHSSWAHKDTSWTQRCSSCTWSTKFLLPRFDERTLWAAWSVSCNWSGSVYLSESFSLRGKTHNHRTQRIKKMFMWKLCFFFCFNL